MSGVPGMVKDAHIIRPLKEKQCEVCYKWHNKSILKGNVCPKCLEEMETIPNTFSMEEKKDFLKYFKNSNKKNVFTNLTQNEIEQLKKCKSCVWLRNIDYLKLKINCASPICQKAV